MVAPRVEQRHAGREGMDTITILDTTVPRIRSCMVVMVLGPVFAVSKCIPQ